MVKLDVPMFGQPIFYYCVPACIKMVVEYVRREHGTKIPRLKISTIARIVKTTIDGTAPKDVENMNEALARSVPSVEFKTQFLGRFPEIVRELNEKRPVIVWINCVDPPDTVWHAIVVTGFDPEHNKIFYNEPDGAIENEEEVGIFINKMGVQGKMVKVLIGKIIDRHIDEWHPRNEEREA